MSYLPKSFRLNPPMIPISLGTGEVRQDIPSGAHQWFRLLRYDEPVSVYFHIPFCQHRCAFCRFYSLAARADNVKSRFLIALEKELSLANSLIGLRRLNIQAVSVGGGTPFELTVAQLSELLRLIERYLNVRATPAIEYSLEINPHDAAEHQTYREKLELLRLANVNRLSVGVQSLDDKVLRANGSRHSAADVTACVEGARACSFRNVNVDLLFRLARQSLHSWDHTLRRICGLHPDHVSLFGVKSAPASFMRRNTERAAGLWVPLAARRLGDVGYTEYFPRAFARTRDFTYRYEVNTFLFGKPVLGFGPGAVTSTGQSCYRNMRDLIQYEELLEGGMLPIDADTIHHPCDRFLARLAYIGGNIETYPSKSLQPNA